jgi:cytochrome P450
LLHFTHPDKFNINRNPNQHIVFGSGIHTWFGLCLAQTEASTAVQQIFTRFPNATQVVPFDEVAWNAGSGTRSTIDLLKRLSPSI